MQRVNQGRKKEIGGDTRLENKLRVGKRKCSERKTITKVNKKIEYAKVMRGTDKEIKKKAEMKLGKSCQEEM